MLKVKIILYVYKLNCKYVLPKWSLFFLLLYVYPSNHGTPHPVE